MAVGACGVPDSAPSICTQKTVTLLSAAPARGTTRPGLEEGTIGHKRTRHAPPLCERLRSARA